MTNNISRYGLALAIGLGGFFGTAAADDGVVNFGERTPSKQELIDALVPAEQPKNIEQEEDDSVISKGRQRGIKPVQEAYPKTAAVQQPKGISFNVLFELDSAELTADAKNSLSNLGEVLANQGKDFMYVVEGHTDSRGTSDHNMSLSYERAEKVKAYLVQRYGVNPANIVTVGKGEKEPMDKFNPESYKNRRVQVLFQGRRNN